MSAVLLDHSVQTPDIYKTSIQLLLLTLSDPRHSKCVRHV